ncbi:MAG: hypothetical protein OK436_06600 [Thaumarchaeota archaeon]|nr:hypothetical protein [Nitrososphaerota archaeon]
MPWELNFTGSGSGWRRSGWFAEIGDRAPHVVEMAIDTLDGFAWTVGVTAAGTRGGIGGGDGH